MRNELLEATRLTRQGQVAEATALIKRSLGLSTTTASALSPDMWAASHGTSATTVERPALEPPVGMASDAQAIAAAQATTPRPVKVQRVRPAAPYLVNLGELPMPGARKMPAARRRPGRVPPDAIAPAVGQWLAGSYSGTRGARAYKLYVPSGYNGKPMPLIVMLHGCTQDPDDFAAGTRMNFLAETAGLLVVYPEQSTGANASGCWNWFQPDHQQRHRGEPSLIAGITRQVMVGHHADASQVYVAGLSAGGAMAAILAAAYGDLYAAVGVHSGLPAGSAHDLPSALAAMKHGRHAGQHARGQTIPLILFHGDRDSTVHPHNADRLIQQWTAGPAKPHVTDHQGQSTGGKAYTRAVYHDPSGHAVVERWTIHGAAHAWSGGSPNGSYTDPAGPDASGEVLRFFREHQLKS